MPIRIDDYIYYRRTDNHADALTIYRFPVDELSKWHEFAKPDCDGNEAASDKPHHINDLMTQVPPYPHDPDFNEKLNNS